MVNDGYNRDYPSWRQMGRVSILAVMNPVARECETDPDLTAIRELPARLRNQDLRSLGQDLTPLSCNTQLPSEVTSSFCFFFFRGESRERQRSSSGLLDPSGRVYLILQRISLALPISQPPVLDV